MTKKQLEKIIDGLKQSLENSENVSKLLMTDAKQELAELCEAKPYILSKKMLQKALGTDKQEKALELYRHIEWEIGFMQGLRYALYSLELEEEKQED